MIQSRGQMLSKSVTIVIGKALLYGTFDKRPIQYGNFSAVLVSSFIAQHILLILSSSICSYFFLIGAITSQLSTR